MNWIIFVIVGLDVICFIVFLTAGLSSRFYPIYYRKKYSPASVKNIPGSVAVFIPCKGVYPSFEQNVQNIIKIIDEYDKIRIFFIVENKTDPAFPVIQRNCDNNKKVFVLEAGTATSCSQKNYNLIKGINSSGEKDDIYLFLDSDTDISREKLAHLLTPLSDSAFDATSGFQWNVLKKKNFGDRFMSFLIATQWMNLNLPVFNWVWGGAMAIKRRTFESLKTKEYWSKRVVDDISLVSLLKKNKKNVCFVPLAINEQHQGITSVKKAMEWYKRQYLYLKFYTFPLWLLGLSALTFLSGKKWLLPIALIVVAIVKPEFVLPLLIYTVLLMGLEMIVGIFMKRPCRDNFALPVWLLLTPFFTALCVIPMLTTIFTQKLLWAGVHYSINREGIVTDIER